MQSLEVSVAVRPIYESLGVKQLIKLKFIKPNISAHPQKRYHQAARQEEKNNICVTSYLVLVLIALQAQLVYHKVYI
jgi:hypothetical protein